LETAAVFEAQVHTVPMASPDDVGAVAALFDSGAVDPADVAAIIAQTEGDGYARGYSALSLQLLFGQRLGISTADVFVRIPMLMIGGTAGLMSPHFTLFVNKPAADGTKSAGARLAIGVASTRRLNPEEYGTAAQIELVASGVREAMRRAGITSPDEVACIELKCPQMTAKRAADASARGKTVVNANPMTVSSMSRGASALGAAVALGEVSPTEISDAIVAGRPDLYTMKGSASSGSEQDAVRIVVLGNVAGAPGDYRVGNGVMEHQLDVVGARAAFTAAGLRLEDGIVVPEDRRKVAAVFVNAGANSLPHCLGRRHTMATDFMAAFAGHVAKAVAHANVAAIAQDTLVLGNAGSEHQGKPGSNLVCVVANHGGGGA
jgi:cyanuric acid amidohydrolase